MRIVVLVSIILLASCSSDNRSQPRPHQYPKILFPQQTYNNYSSNDCPFMLQIPSNSEVKKKKLLFGEVSANPCWFDVELKDLGATIHCSYYPINKEYTFDKLKNDAFSLASKHNVKATYKEEFIIKNKHGAGGLIFKINGPVATPYQFFLTDSVHHFLRGSLYFNEKVDMDSIAPVITHIEKDIDMMLNTLQWTKT